MSDKPLVNQPTMRPTRKVEQGIIAGGLSAAAVTPFLVFALESFYGDGQVPQRWVNFLPYLSALGVWAIQSARSYFAREREP